MSNKSKIIKSKKNSIIILIGFIFMFISFDSFAQVFKPFEQRTSTQVDDKYKNKTIYNVRGDFKMIGNTNLRVTNGSGADTETNSNANMSLVDLDNNSSTTNSSSAQLTLPDNTCTNIVYAGLYWSGRNNISENNFVTTNGEARNNSSIEFNNANLTTTITTTNQVLSNTNVQVPTYIIKNDALGIYYEFKFTSRKYTAYFIFLPYNDWDNESVMYRTSPNGQWLNIPSTFSSSGTRRVATFNSPITLSSSNEMFTINSLSQNENNNETVSNNSNDFYISYTKIVSSNNYSGNKHKIKFAKDGQSYQNLTADSYFIGSSSQDDIFTAYKDVTNYVKQHGVGNYWGADIDLVSGNGSSVGYFGGWGLIVIYENPSMKWRDITIFDGYAYVSGGNEYELPLSGFHAAQNDNVNVTMGMMAGEGDRSITGDAFRIRNAANNNWVTLSHANNATNNFFNSSILTDGARNPNLVNNTGLDIVKFDLPNTNNSIIANNATSTRFQYANNGGGGTDTYVIYNIVFAVDAYVPNAQNENTPVSIYIPNTNPTLPGTTLQSGTSEFNYRIEHLQPNDEVTVAMNLYNYGNEKIVGPLINPNGPTTGTRGPVQMNIDIPFGMTLKSASVTPIATNNDVLTNIPNNNPTDYNTHFNNLFWTNPVNNQSINLNSNPSTLPTSQMGGILSWRPTDIPRQNESSTTRKSMAKLTYTLKVIENCTILKSSEDNCILNTNISGNNIGFGASSGTPMAEEFVIGYSSAACSNQPVPIYGNTVMEIVPTEAYFQTCGGTILGEEILITHFCEPTGNATLAWSEIIGFYPSGTKYYKTKPTTPNYQSSEIFYSATTPISLQLEPIGGNGEYEEWIYAMLPGVNNTACYFNIHIVYTTIYTHPVIDNVFKICARVPFVWPLTLSSIGQQNGLSIQVFSSNNETNLLPNTHTIETVGSHTFYAREVMKNDSGVVTCAGPLVPFTVTVEGCPIPINPMIQTPLNRN